MLPYLITPTCNSSMHFSQDGALYPSAYLQKEPTIRNYVSGYLLNEPAPQSNIGEYHFVESAAKPFICEYHPNEPAIKHYIGEYHPNGLAVKNCFGEYHTMRDDTEEYLGDLRNARKIRNGKIKNVLGSTMGFDPIRRDFSRSLKRKKLKSFMVRDLIDLPADENQRGIFDATVQCQNRLSRAALTPPPEPEIPWKKYESVFPDSSVENKLDSFSQDAMGTFSTCFRNKYEPSYCAKLGDTLEHLYQDPVGTCEASDRILISPSSESQGTNSDIGSGDSATSPCGKAKRVRTIFSCSQLERLEMEFERTHYMVGPERTQLASELKLSESQVKVWFQNRRIKQRKQFHEQQQAILSKLKESQERDCPAESEKEASKENSLSSAWSEESNS